MHNGPHKTTLKQRLENRRSGLPSPKRFKNAGTLNTRQVLRDEPKPYANKAEMKQWKRARRLERQKA